MSQARPKTAGPAAGGGRPARRPGPVAVFILKFAGFMAVYYLLVSLPVGDRWLYHYLRANAVLANGLLQWWGAGTAVSDISIRSAHFAITVRRGCDAVEPSWMLCSAILAFPASGWHRVLGCVVGTLLLQVLNLARITSLYYIGWQWPDFFSRAHLEIWPVLFIVAAVLLWMGWIRGSRPRTPRHAPA